MDTHQKYKRPDIRGIWLPGLLILGCWVLTSSDPARAQERSGFTLQLDFGAGFIAPEVLQGRNFGLACGIGAGGFVNPDLAVLGRANTVMIFMEDSSHFTAKFFSVFFGVHAQYWIGSSFFISGGPGAILVAADDSDVSSSNVFWGISLLTGYSFLTTSHHSLQVTLEFTNISLLGVMGNLSLAWQFF